MGTTLTALQASERLPLHFRGESQDRRVMIAQATAGAPALGAIMVTTATTDSEQEKARARLLCELLPRLQHVERVRHVVLESRAGGDRFDRRTDERLRKTHRLTADLRLDHAGKQLAMLWIADFVASSYVAATRHGELKPWEIINGAHPIEITELAPR
ncbi:hypothetical protein M8C13_27830 [Crossiella sp. SN42]|uniref:hypothetical protein n=1 Tax=Crossiella sp. SN42 TaxID=2944808 RepID=UPI00207CABEE|nr:hypothetical protein [Crossiella sp. SN42]MCO1579567.1 hypothetical protein [Crossiella sp. SN42]